MVFHTLRFFDLVGQMMANHSAIIAVVALESLKTLDALPDISPAADDRPGCNWNADDQVDSPTQAETDVPIGE